MSSDAINIIDQLSREKGIDKGVFIEALKMAVEAAARKRLPHIENIHSEFNEDTGQIEIFVEKTIVKTVENPDFEVSYKEAAKTVPDCEVGETVLVPQALENYGRIAAQLAKQVILQKVREAEIESIYNEYVQKKGELLNGLVHRFEYGDIIVDLGKAEAILPRREQVFRETFNRGERIRTYLLDVKKTSKNAMIILSRTHVDLIRRLFEMEVPEISEGMVEIMGIVREPNGRTKIAVRSNDRDIDAVGACVGMRGMRVQSIVQELRGEKIDIVEYSEDAETFVRNALSPAKVSRILTDHKEKHMTIIVADDQMSLAIGKKGQNVKLATRLVKWRIDIKGESETRALLEKQHLILKPKSLTIDFEETVKNLEELGEPVVAVLSENDIHSFDEIINRGVEGLTQIPGISPEQAESLLDLAESSKVEIRRAEAPKPEEPQETPEETGDLEPAETDASETTAQELEEDAETKPADTEPPETEPREFPLSDLSQVDDNIIDILSKNGFQTLAELSITPIEELLAIEGIEESTAKVILEQARQVTENYENA
ncbi:MAG: transcription termination factor NusA [Nitrospinales bacterium]